MPFSDGARRSTFVYLAMSLGVLVLVGGVAYEWQQERGAAARSTAPGASAVAKASPAPRETPQQRPAARRRGGGAPCNRLRLRLRSSAKNDHPGEDRYPGKTMVAVAPAPAPPAPARNRLVVRTTDGEAWIEIKDSGDRMLVSSLNPPGSERVVRGRPAVSPW